MEDLPRKIAFRAEGIVCTGCATDMETVLRDTDGILDASVDFSDGIITIEYDPAEIDENEVFARVKKLGFKAAIIET